MAQRLSVVRSTLRKSVLALLVAIAAPATAAQAPAWTSLGPWGGTIRAVAIDPRDPNVLWAGTSYNGLYRSRDRGATWVRRSDGLDSPWISAIALDPFAIDRLWVVAAGGVYRSENAGEEWRLINSALALWRAGDLLLADPARRERLFALQKARLLRSEDGGGHWSPVREGVTAVALDGAGGLYAAVRDVLLRSADGGRSFRRLPPTGMTRIELLAVHPRRARELWAGAGPDVWRSLDGGESWTALGRPSPGKVTQIVPHSRVRDVVYAVAANRLWKSVDGGATWEGIPLDASGRARLEALAIDPRNPRTLVVGLRAFDSPGGVLRSTTGGRAFRSISRGIAALPVTTFDVDPHDPDRVAAGVFSVGVLVSEDGGVSWQVALDRSSVQALAFDPVVSGRLWALASGVLILSDDLGRTWMARALPEAGCSCYWLTPDPQVADRLYLGGFGALERSDDAAQSWRKLQGWPVQPSFIYGADGILIDPGDPDHLLVDGFVFEGDPRRPNQVGRLIESFDGGATWVRIDESLPWAPITIAADPLDFSRVWVTTGNGLYRRVAAGWELVSEALVLHQLEAGDDGSLLGVGFANGTPVWRISLWYSTDGGASWLDVGVDLPSGRFFVRAGDRVFAAASAGIFTRELPPTAAGRP